MLLHSKKDFYKKTLLVSFLVGLIALVTFGVVRHIQNQANAATPSGGSVNVRWNVSESIWYGDIGWSTNVYRITTSSGQYVGYCSLPSKSAIPTQDDPNGGNFKATIVSNPTANQNAILLMIYVSTIDNSYTRAVMNDLFQTVSDSGKRYAYSHAVIGALYDNDYYGLNASETNLVNSIIPKLRNLINNNADVWILAKGYRLYVTDRSGTAYSSSNFQDVVWIEPVGYNYGSIKVQKKDSATQSSTPQGGASLAGITFEVYNNSGTRIYNPRKQAFYNNGALVASGTTNANGEVTFSDLVAGSYLVKETATNSSYNLTSTASQGVTITTNGQTQTVTFYNDVKKGSIKVSKRDVELGTCNPLGKAALSGSSFQIINNSAKPVYYGGKSIANGAVVDTKSLSSSSCEITFSNLPYGSYIVKETAAGTGYNTNSTTKTITIPTNNSTSLSTTFDNQVIRGDVKFKKVDSSTSQGLANIPFRITSKTTGESHIVVTNASGVVNTSSSVNLHSNNTNGYDGISNYSSITYQAYGTWFGKSASNGAVATVNNSLGALPYDTYEIVELSCNQNRFCVDISSEHQTFTISTNATVVDLGNWENDCTEFSLATTAVDNADGDKYIAKSGAAKIKDTISYCLKANMNFTIKGTLMDKTTGQPVKKNGVAIQQSINVNSSTDCGQIEMYFEFDASTIAGHELVVYESLYYGSDLILAHENINDAAQTVYVVSLSTTAVDNVDGDKYVEASSTAKIKDTVAYCAKVGTTFTLKGTLMDKTTGQPLKKNGNNIEVSTNVTPTTACGQAVITFDVDTSGLGSHEIVVFERMYEGNKLIISHENINDATQTVNIVRLATTAVDNADNDKYLTTSSTAKVKDTVSYCLKKDTNYILKGVLMDKTTGQPVKKNGANVEQNVSINSGTGCGQLELFFEFDATDLAGHELVVFESAYLGDTLILAHENLNDTAQTVYIIRLDTVATDDADNDKYVEAKKDAKIKDVVSYCAKVGTKYTLKGTLMDKTTGQPLTRDGNVIEASADFTPTTACGETGIIFDVDTSYVAGHEIVVYEKLYEGDHLIISHEDINDAAQAVDIVSLGTSAVDNLDRDKYVIVGDDAEIRDTINYCAKTGRSFTIKGVLMDKTTGQRLTLAGGATEKIVTINPTSVCGQIRMFFEFDSTGLAGHEIVVFEEMFEGNNLIASHKDLTDVSQTVNIISLSTHAENKIEIEEEEEEPEEGDDGEQSGDDGQNNQGEQDDQNNQGDDEEQGDGEEEEEEEPEEEINIENEFLKRNVEAKKNAKIIDTISYCLKAGDEFTLKGTLMDKTTGEPLMKDGEIIEETIQIIPEANCGQAEMIFEFDASALTGHEIVVFEKAYRSDRLTIAHEDIDDEEQTLGVISLTTYATEAKSGQKDVVADGVVRIRDEVKYCLRPNTEFTVKGTLMNQETGEKLLINGEPIEQTLTFTTGDDCCGTTEMFYEFDATGLGGMTVVIFENIYEGEDLIIKHNDLGNTSETFYLMVPAPDTGFVTKVQESSNEHNPIILVAVIATVLATGTYGVARFTRRKKILASFKD